MAEFFQLFKTPWEFYRRDNPYDFVIASSDKIPANLDASLLVVFNSDTTTIDRSAGVTVQRSGRSDWLEFNTTEFPLYGSAAVVEGTGHTLIRRRGDHASVGLAISEATRQTVRVGYDLFREVSYVLSEGQPAVNAHIPTLDIHISLLRSLMVSSGKPFVEVPPVPSGYEFMVCLSHDVDFTGIREHKFDRTMFGFLYRATLGSLWQTIKRKCSWSKLLQNWKAALSLPFVHLGLVDDFWLEFDRYLEIEKGMKGTYYFIPFKNCAGARRNGLAPANRGVRYDFLENKTDIDKLKAQGCEIGLHGIDAWRDADRAKVETDRIKTLARQQCLGVRMHWLYFDGESYETLDRAGLSYDSTCGYNDAIGFRAGTTQVFSPSKTRYLLELPLHIQDTAMFYPDRMNLSEAEASRRCVDLLRTAAAIGGVVTLNWHTRSLSAERLWGDFYVNLLREVKRYRVWFGTAQEIVTWFRNRRALCFQDLQFREEGLSLKVIGPSSDDQPCFVVRVYPPGRRWSFDSTPRAAKPVYFDVPWSAALNCPYPNDRRSCIS